ncbi:MAG: hypothetical protein ACHQT9_03360 [Candidatus Saccharimonadales bacterium]
MAKQPELGAMIEQYDVFLAEITALLDLPKVMVKRVQSGDTTGAVSSVVSKKTTMKSVVT